MAVLQYPLDPLACWTFDRHGSLFDRKTPVVDINPIQDGMPYKREAHCIIFSHDSKIVRPLELLMRDPGVSISSYKGSGITLPFDLIGCEPCPLGCEGKSCYTGNVGIGVSVCFFMWLNFNFFIDDTSANHQLHLYLMMQSCYQQTSTLRMDAYCCCRSIC